MAEPDRLEIAAWVESDGTFHSVENGEREPTSEELGERNVEVVTSYRDADDIVHYLTIYGPFDDEYGIEDAIGELLVAYGISAE
jgi:hypothetical protein